MGISEYIATREIEIAGLFDEAVSYFVNEWLSDDDFFLETLSYYGFSVRELEPKPASVSYEVIFDSEEMKMFPIVRTKVYISLFIANEYKGYYYIVKEAGTIVDDTIQFSE